MKKTVDLLNGKILSSLMELAVPIMATSLLQMAYNLTDMAWIGRVGSAAVASVGSAGMYTWLSTGVVMLAKMGGQVKAAHSLGEGNGEKAAQYGKGAIQLAAALAVVYGLIMVAFSGKLIGFFNLQDPGIVEDAEKYLKIAGGMILFSFLNQTLTGLFTASGDSKTPFLANFAGLAGNMILDPLLIFGIGGLPGLGAAGAAAATVTAQAIVTFLMLRGVKRDKVLFDKIRIWEKTPREYLWEMIRISLPSSIQETLYCAISMVLTRLIAGWGDRAVAVQRVGGQIESISWMAAEGFGMALNAFIGQNYGAGKYQRMKKGYVTAFVMMMAWGAFTTGVLVFLNGPIFRLFINEPDVVPVGMDYLRILGYGQMFMCLELMTVGALAGMGKTFVSSCISISLTSARIPLALLLGGTALGLNGIWWALTVSSTLKGITFCLTFIFILNRIGREKAG
ncbi:MATE family efflux transporter [Lachnospiraceae bacterium 62-35]